jgi:glycosyltransferase involved in cell wall biosynthesis
VDGLEWKRAKWGPVGQRYYRLAEALAVRWSDALIADAQGIADYYRTEFDAATRLIAYGAPLLRDSGSARLTSLGLEARRYHLVVARFEPENHVLQLVRGYVASRAAEPLVVVGSAPYANVYTEEIRTAADDRVQLVGGIWDQDLLDELYANALTYLHGHSVGGTNPSLLRAAGAGAPVIAFDVDFNHEVIGTHGWFFADEVEAAQRIEAAEADPAAAIAVGAALQQVIARYNWDDVAARYERLLGDLATTGQLPRRDRPRGRRERA